MKKKAKNKQLYWRRNENDYLIRTMAESNKKAALVEKIAKCADVDAKNEDGLTPLDAASQKVYWAIVEMLRTHKTQE